MQLFSADPTIFLKKNFAPKNLPSKVANDRLGWAVFRTANRPKTSPNLKFCFIKIAHCATYL